MVMRGREAERTVRQTDRLRESQRAKDWVHLLFKSFPPLQVCEI